MNFGQFLASVVGDHTCEALIHPHAPEERAEEFHSLDNGSSELEVLTLLNALVHLYKPRLVLETGTGRAFGTYAIACALRANQVGHLHTVESFEPARKEGEANFIRLDHTLVPLVTFHTGMAHDILCSWAGKQFDFVYFDSELRSRHTEFELMLERNLLTPNALCAFHDTSRLREQYHYDFNREMIQALDRHSQGKQWLECDLSRGFRLIKLG